MASGSGSSTGGYGSRGSRGGGSGTSRTSALQRRINGAARLVNYAPTSESMAAAWRGPNGGRRRSPDRSKLQYRAYGRRYYSSREALERTLEDLPF